jgi:uncharacterized membrane protein
VTRAFTATAALLALATVTGLAILWPSHPKAHIGAGLATHTENAKVVDVRETFCPGLGGQKCQLATIRLETGAHKGRRGQLQLNATGLDPNLDPGDEITVTEAPQPGNQPVAGPAYAFNDFRRGGPMIVLAAIFAAVVILFARLRGAMSLVGLAISLGIVLLFVVPGILAGESPLAVAIVGSMAVMLVTIPLAHGWGPKTLAAVLGTGGSLLLTALLAWIFTKATHLTGFSSEEATFLQLSGENLSLQGLLLAGMVIGALGVLDDVTVSQASTVLALRAANPSLHFPALFRIAMHVGRDHVSATVNTLVLAYVGASLPVLLVFHAADLKIGDVLGFEIVAKEIVAMLVGSIGLIAAVPVTTALATALGLSQPPERLAAGDLAHAH